MLRKLLFAIAGLLAVSAASGQTMIRQGIQGTPVPASTYAPQPRFRVLEYPAFAAFEYEVLNKGDVRKDVYATMWTKALNVCEGQNGYVTEYHSGYKHIYADTREAGVREHANATCALEAAPEAAIAQAAAPRVSVYGNATTPGDHGNIVATGSDKRQAYAAARSKAYQTCIEQDRRVERMSVAFHAHPQIRVHIVFACAAEPLG